MRALLLDLLIFDSVFAWTLLGVTILAIVLVPKIFGVKLLNGLLFAQITLFFNASTIIAGMNTEYVSTDRGIHFFSVEFFFFSCRYSIYLLLFVIGVVFMCEFIYFFYVVFKHQFKKNKFPYCIC